MQLLLYLDNNRFPAISFESSHVRRKHVEGEVQYSTVADFLYLNKMLNLISSSLLKVLHTVITHYVRFAFITSG